VELAKDLGAMLSSDGGHVVLGIDNATAQPTGSLDGYDLRKFDSAALQGVFARWLPAPFDLRSAVHTIDEHAVVVVYIAPHPDVFAPFLVAGAYEKDGEQRLAFRAGEVFCRHGSASERWDQRDFRRFRERVQQREREAARTEFTSALLAQQRSTDNVRTLIDAPSAAFSWRLASDTFVPTLTELVRRDDRVPITVMLRAARGDAQALVRGDDPADLPLLLDRLTEMAALGLTLEDRDLFMRAVGALDAIYNSVFTGEYGQTESGLSVRPARLWLGIVTRIMALGGLAVRERAWNAVRELSEHPPRGNERYSSWLRHGLTEAARANLLLDPERRRVGKSLIVMAVADADRIAILRDDVRGADDALLTSVCQFDFFACVVALGNPPRGAAFYPNFAGFHSHRTDPAAALLIDDQDARATLFPHSDQRLANALRDVGRTASRESQMLNGFDGFNATSVREFIREHATDALS
jgi:hypothetical protein